jgi:hypothetical protein
LNILILQQAIIFDGLFFYNLTQINWENLITICQPALKPSPKSAYDQTLKAVSWPLQTIEL